MNKKEYKKPVVENTKIMDIIAVSNFFTQGLGIAGAYAEEIKHGANDIFKY